VGLKKKERVEEREREREGMSEKERGREGERREEEARFLFKFEKYQKEQS